MVYMATNTGKGPSRNVGKRKHCSMKTIMAMLTYTELIKKHNKTMFWISFCLKVKYHGSRENYEMFKTDLNTYKYLVLTNLRNV